jgi:hypothetical protein
MTTTRITVCPRGHRTQVSDRHGIPGWMTIGPDAAVFCHYCKALILKTRPAKAKRPGES